MSTYSPKFIVETALQLLPSKFNTPQARAQLISIGLQESRFQYRKQINGPARGYWQFERGGGVMGVLHHSSTKDLINDVLREMNYPADSTVVHEALADNDILACVMARLLMWTYPGALPEQGDHAEGWNQYIATWRPGKPHPETWKELNQRAWDMV